MSTLNRIRVLVAEDHPMMRRSLRTILQSFPDVSVVGESISGEEAVVSAGTLQPNVVLMDINIPIMDGIAATRLIKMKYPHIAVIGLTCHTPGDLRVNSMTKAGAFEVLPKEKALDLYEIMQRAVISAPFPPPGSTHGDHPATGTGLEC
jgi:DNA-binding NarL/FixJ family response regulator